MLNIDLKTKSRLQTLSRYEINSEAQEKALKE
jgi:hypothetical protein